MNSFLLSSAVLAALVAVCFSELCTPDQWEGFEASQGGYVHHRHPGIIREMTSVSYDGKNKMKASTIRYRNNDYQNTFKVVMRYEADEKNDYLGKAYVVNEKEKKCWIKKLYKPFRKACIPDDAKLVDKYSMGLKDGGLKVSGYEMKKDDFDVYIAVSMLDEKTIVPVTESITGHFMGTSFLQGMGYGDITPGIANASVFAIPALCNDLKDSEFSISEFLLREHYILGF